MADLKRKIEAMAHGSEERKMGVREWRRLKRIPPGSVENGVIRSYVSFQPFSSLPIAKVMQLEWLTSVPWPNSTPIPSISNEVSAIQPQLKDRSFLQAARVQLDSDHFGLEKIKKRLIEYLAVVRLKELNGEREELAEQRAAEIEIKAALEDRKDSKSDGQQQGKELILYDNAQTPRTVPSKPLRASKKKGVKGPILL